VVRIREFDVHVRFLILHASMRPRIWSGRGCGVPAARRRAWGRVNLGCARGQGRAGADLPGPARLNELAAFKWPPAESPGTRPPGNADTHAGGCNATKTARTLFARPLQKRACTSSSAVESNACLCGRQGRENVCRFPQIPGAPVAVWNSFTGDGHVTLLGKSAGVNISECCGFHGLKRFPEKRAGTAVSPPRPRSGKQNRRFIRVSSRYVAKRSRFRAPRHPLPPPPPRNSPRVSSGMKAEDIISHSRRQKFR